MLNSPSGLLAEVLYEIRRRHRLLLSLFVMVSFGCLAWALSSVPGYRAVAALQVSALPAAGMPGNAAPLPAGDDAAAVETLIADISGRRLLDRVLADLTASGSVSAADRVDLFRGLEILPVDDGVVRIEFTYASAEVAFLVVQRLVATLIDSEGQALTAESEQSRSFVERQLQVNEERLARLSLDLKAFLGESEEEDLIGEERTAQEAQLRRELLAQGVIVEDLRRQLSALDEARSPDSVRHGVRYSLQDAIVYPRRSVDGQAVLLALGLPLGLIAALGAVLLFCLLDPRVRTAPVLQAHTGVNVLMVVPAMPTPLEQRHERRRRQMTVVMLLFAIVVYGLAIWKGTGGFA